MAYPILTRDNAKEAFKLLKESIEPAWSNLESKRGEGAIRSFDQLKADVKAIQSAFQFPLTQGRASDFEGQIGVLLHETIVESAAVSDPDFWRWIVFRPLLEATLDRHPLDLDKYQPDPTVEELEDGIKNIPAFFGFGSLLDNFAYRAWLRAEIGHRPNTDPQQRYELALRGDQDLWRSHLIRVRYSFHREMAHALIEFQYPDDQSEGTLKKGDKADGIRLLAKKLARTQANTVYPQLSKEQCRVLIHRLANGLTTQVGGQFTSNGTT
jgi:hypothetical protein